MKRIYVIGLMLLLYHIAYTQNYIKGNASDANNEPLVGVSIFIPDMNKGTISDHNGNYELTDLPNGNLKIMFKYIGYSNYFETVNLNGKSVEINVVLKPTTIEMEDIVVSGGYTSTQHENAVKIDILKLESLEKIVTPNFTEALTKIPGVDMISKGNGVSKPVIRGLSMNDILVLNNGVRFENYQYSSHHPLGIDEFGVERVEIIKGPASLLYGSDAIGGVINFIKEKPTTIGTIVGDYNMQLFSNSQGFTNNIGIKGASKKLFGGIRFGQKTNADYLQGGETFVPNSRFNEMSFKANAGITGKTGTFKLFYDFNNQKIGLVEDEALEQILQQGRKNKIFYQEFNNHLLSSKNKLYLGKYKLDVNAAIQNTELTHFGEEGNHELQMELVTLTYDIKLHLPSNNKSEYIFGVQGINQTNTNLNNLETILLPNANISNYSAFCLLQYTFIDKVKLQTGIRYDYKNISTKAIGQVTDITSYRAALDTTYGSFSGSLGATYNLNEDLLFRTNFASAYRTPNLAELTSNGPHELRYEIGDKKLVPENSYEIDLSMHLHKDNVTVDLAGFYNIVNNFIFLSPTIDTTNAGLNIYRFKQENSVLFGGEAGVHFHPKNLKWLHFVSTFSTVIGKQQNGSYLPFIPANKLKFELRVEKEKLWVFNRAFAGINTNTAFAQNNPAADETTTDTYTLINISTGGKININNQQLSLSIGVNNLLDTKYVNHLSTLKEVNYYDPGRNISLNLRVPFGIKTN